MKLENVREVEGFLKAVDQCKGDVVIISTEGNKEEFNLKSLFSRYIAIGRLCEDHGDFEVFCHLKEDEPILLQYFHEVAKERQ